MELFFFWLIMAVVVAFVANSKGKSGGLWFFYGLVIWPIALIHAIVTPKEPEAVERQQQSEGKMRCPNCADWVYKQAKTCPHCQYRLTAKSQAQSAALSKSVRENVIIEDEEEFWKGDRNLDAAKYKIHLSEKYDIKKNDLFEKYVCLDEMFDTLDEALSYADKADRESEAAYSEEHKRLSQTTVQTGVIGPLQKFSFQEFATGEVLVTHSSGAQRRFQSLDQVKTIFASQYAESQGLKLLSGDNGK